LSGTDVWVLVPVYNESSVVGRTIADLVSRFANVVCVDDGSEDGSGEVAHTAGATVLRHVVNQGQGAALQTGFDYLLRHTDAQYVVTFDADGQHVVEDAVRMVERARTSGVDVVLASRFAGSTENMPRMRRLVLMGGLWFTKVTAKLDVTDTHNGLRVLNRGAITRIRLDLPRMAYASQLLGSIVPNGLSYVEEPVTVLYSDYSRSKGQRNSNSINILYDLAVRRIRSAR
jgi:glycosyltransferase involved in cell wall biosynthesis